jgi:hypothetical protein
MARRKLHLLGTKPTSPFLEGRKSLILELSLGIKGNAGS